MSLYGEKFKIGGLSCGLVLRGSANGEYRVVFEREYASLEQIEALEWDPPVLEGSASCPRATASRSRISSTAPPPAATMWCFRWGRSIWGM